MTAKPLPAIASESTGEFRGRVYDSILETIGATPLVRLSKLAKAHDVEAEIHRRGVEGWLTPAIQKGEQAILATGEPAFIRRYSDTLLLARARALMPSKYGEKKSIDITHHKAGGMMVIEASDVQHFTQAQIEALGDLMSTIRANREGEAPEKLTYQPAPVLEIPLTEVEAVAVEVAEEETAEEAIPY